MPCTKAELVAAINSYAAARCTSDGNLINMAAHALTQVVDTLEFAEPTAAEESSDD